MFPPSCIRQLIRQTKLLVIGYSTCAIIAAVGVAVMLYAIAKNPQWEFVVIGLINFVLADVARCKAIQQWQQLGYFKVMLRDFSEPATPSKNSAHSV